MRESPGGVYTGSYVIPRGANFDDVALIGRLSSGDETALAAAPQTVSASGTPPGISDFAPDANAMINTNRPAVYASFAADAVPVNPASAILWINGRDVTSECVRTAQFIQYLPSYSYPNGTRASGHKGSGLGPAIPRRSRGASRFEAADERLRFLPHRRGRDFPRRSSFAMRPCSRSRISIHRRRRTYSYSPSHTTRRSASWRPTRDLPRA